jgi:uncharacterized membrane protein YdjX (TVP38/TMEM64 family)
MNKKSAIASVLVVGLAVVAYLGWQGPLGFGDLAKPDAIKQMVADFGVFGPLAVIALMVLAVVMTPIPSAPIARCCIWPIRRRDLYRYRRRNRGDHCIFSCARFGA